MRLMLCHKVDMGDKNARIFANVFEVTKPFFAQCAKEKLKAQLSSAQRAKAGGFAGYNKPSTAKEVYANLLLTE